MTEQTIIRIGLTALVTASFGIYSLLNKPKKNVDILVSGLDGKIPFVPMFIVPYMLYFPYLFIVIGYGILTSPRFIEIAVSALLVQLAAAAVYIIHQTHAPRPEIKGSDIFSRLTRFIYTHDEPYCAFPSLHVAYSFLCGYWALALFPGVAPLLLLLSVSIVASTMLVKQHVVADVVAGASVAVLSLIVAAGL